MEFFIVLLAIFKYVLLVLLFLILLVLVLALILMLSPIRYKAVVNYKDDKLYYNVDVTYLGKIVGFNLKGVKDKFSAYVRLLHKKVYLQPDEEQEAKKKATANSTKMKTENGGNKTAKSKKETASELPLDVVQKVTPTTTLEESSKTSSINSKQDTAKSQDIHNTKDKVNLTKSLDTNQSVSQKPNNTQNINDTNSSFKREEKVSKNHEYDSIKSNTNNTSDDQSKENNNENNNENSNESKEEKLSFKEKINKTLNDINFYIESYKTYPYRDKLFIKFKKIFSNICDALFPKVFDCSGQIYVHSPSTTGQLLGFLYMLHGLNRTFNVSVDGDFETEKNDFTALISGRIIIFKLVSPVVSFCWLGLKAEAKRRKITRFKLIKILIKNDKSDDKSE